MLESQKMPNYVAPDKDMAYAWLSILFTWGQIRPFGIAIACICLYLGFFCFFCGGGGESRSIGCDLQGQI